MNEEELSHPNHWYNRAADQHASAGAVWDAMTNDPRDTSKRLGFAEGHSMQIACQPVYLMLCGLSLEVVIKAALVQRGEMSLKHEHHRIVDLSIAVGCVPTQRQAKLLRFYEASMVWAGRYPAPKSDRLRSVYSYRRLGDEILTSPIKIGNLEFRRNNDADSWKHYSDLWHGYAAMFSLR